jgi:AcrR family transcriptional regulator
MKEKQKLTKEERKEQIVKAAIKLFSQKGFNGTKTKEIAKKAGISEALLFKFFPTKSSLYSAIIAYRIKQLQQTDQSYYQKLDSESFSDFLSRLAKNHIKLIEKDDSFMRLLLFSGLENHRLAKDFYNIRISKIVQQVCKYFEEEIHKGTIRNINPSVAVKIFMGIVYNYLLAKCIFGLKKHANVSEDEFVKIMVDIFLNGIKTQNGK